MQPSSTYENLIKTEDWNREVKGVYWICSKTEKRDKYGQPNGTYTYHWRTYLILADVDQSVSKSLSVEIDIIPVKPDGSAYLTFTSKNYVASRNRFAEFEAQARGTVKQLVKLLIKKGREKYVWDTQSGSGCRYWTEVVARDFEQDGYLRPGSTSLLKSYMDYKAQLDPEGMPLPAPRGYFF